MTSPATLVATGKRHYCAALDGVMCTHGDGAVKRKKCAYCGGRLAVMVGTYGVFVWRGDGRYRIENAVKTFAREAKADEYANANGENLVVRWLVERA